MLAALKGNTEVARALLQASACAAGDAAALALARAQLRQRDAHGGTALHWAAEHGGVGALRACLDVSAQARGWHPRPVPWMWPPPCGHLAHAALRGAAPRVCAHGTIMHCGQHATCAVPQTAHLGPEEAQPAAAQPEAEEPVAEVQK